VREIVWDMYLRVGKVGGRWASGVSYQIRLD
jgi:hypothetical protein